MKKLVSIILTIALLLCSLLSVSYAQSEYQYDFDLQTPIIMIAPFTGSSLGLRNEDGSITDVSVSLDEMTEIESALINSEGILSSFLVGLFTMDYTEFVGIISKACGSLCERLETLQMNPDGTSANDIVLTSGTTPQQTRGKATSGELRDCLNRLGMSSNNIFYFANDYRLGQIENAQKLDTYIQQVKQLTGKSQVTLYGYSGGGQISTTYLSLYADKGDVKNVVLNNAPTAGTKLVTALLERKSFDLNTYFILKEALSEQSIWFQLLGKLNYSFVNRGVYQAVYNVLTKYIKNWCGIWDMVPCEDYVRLRQACLDPVENAEIIKKSNEYHFTVASNARDTFKKAQELGIKVWITSTTGTDIVMCNGVNGDGIVDVTHSSGAISVSSQAAFSTGYVQAATQCKEFEHNHISPERNIDASTAYLPDYTWFIGDGFHMDFCEELSARLLLSNDYMTVFSDNEYPQFIYLSKKAATSN